MNIPTNHCIPRNGIFVRHRVEELAGFIEAAGFGVAGDKDGPRAGVAAGEGVEEGMGLVEEPMLRVAKDHGVPCNCASVGQFVEQFAGVGDFTTAREGLDLGNGGVEVRERIMGFGEGRSGKKFQEEGFVGSLLPF